MRSTRRATAPVASSATNVPAKGTLNVSNVSVFDLYHKCAGKRHFKCVKCKCA